MSGAGNGNASNYAKRWDYATKEFPGSRGACPNARGMNAQGETAEMIPAAQHPSHGRWHQRDLAARHKTTAATVNADHPPQQLGYGYRRIAAQYRVAFC